jgi:hypothetical protein
MQFLLYTSGSNISFWNGCLQILVRKRLLISVHKNLQTFSQLYITITVVCPPSNKGRVNAFQFRISQFSERFNIVFNGNFWIKQVNYSKFYGINYALVIVCQKFAFRQVFLTSDSTASWIQCLLWNVIGTLFAILILLKSLNKGGNVFSNGSLSCLYPWPWR